jgi:molybdopterin-synthase adenylyltransferase
MRYSRQELFIGKVAQRKIQKSTIAVIGIGALGTVASSLLVRAGFNIIIIDHDKVELNNLQRQTLFDEKDVGKSKVKQAAKKLKKINSTVKIQAHNKEVTKDTIKELTKGSNLILDCTDNLLVRFIINDYCKKNKKVWIHSAAVKDVGTVKVIKPTKECFMCFTKEAEQDTCEQIGILNTTSHIIASLQVKEAIKHITKNEAEEKLIRYKDNSISLIKVKPNKKCRCCNGQYDYLN